MNNINEIYSEEFNKFEVQKNKINRLWNIQQRTAELLYTLVEVTKPDRILEIGTSNGFSTFWLSLAAETCGAFVETIEVDENRFNLARSNLNDRSNIIQHFGKAELIIPSLNNKYDFVFIDAGKINYIDYLKLLHDKLQDGSLILADNVISHKNTVVEYLDFIESSKLFDCVTLNIDSGLSVAIYNATKNKNKE